MFLYHASSVTRPFLTSLSFYLMICTSILPGLSFLTKYIKHLLYHISPSIYPCHPWRSERQPAHLSFSFTSLSSSSSSSRLASPPGTQQQQLVRWFMISTTVALKPTPPSLLPREAAAATAETSFITNKPWWRLTNVPMPDIYNVRWPGLASPSYLLTIYNNFTCFKR